MPRVNLIQLRGGTAAAWTSANPVLGSREPGIETDTQRFKFGDGVTAWNSLSYASADSHFVGVYVSEAALTAAHPSADSGDYAYVDAGAANPVELWIWDEDDTEWVQTGAPAIPTAAQVSFTPAGNISAADVQAAIVELDSEKQASLVSGTNIKTVNGTTILGSGDIDLIDDAIVNGESKAPSQNAVFDALALKMDSLITYRTLTASHTLDATDLASINAGDSLNILMNVASANDLTVPPNATQAFPVGTVIAIDQIGAGATTIVAGAGVTIRTSDGLVLANQYSGAYVQKVATNEWYAKGKLKL